MLLSMPSVWSSLQIIEKDLGNLDERHSFAQFVQRIRDRRKGSIENVRVLLDDTKVPGVGLRTLIDDDQVLNTLVITFKDTFNGPFFVPPPTRKVIATSNSNDKKNGVIIQKDYFQSLTLNNVLPWSIYHDLNIDNGLQHLYLNLNKSTKDNMVLFTIAQCKSLQTLSITNLRWNIQLDLYLPNLKYLHVNNSSPVLSILMAESLQTLIFENYMIEDDGPSSFPPKVESLSFRNCKFTQNNTYFNLPKLIRHIEVIDSDFSLHFEALVKCILDDDYGDKEVGMNLNSIKIKDNNLLGLLNKPTFERFVQVFQKVKDLNGCSKLNKLVLNCPRNNFDTYNDFLDYRNEIFNRLSSNVENIDINCDETYSELIEIPK